MTATGTAAAVRRHFDGEAARFDAIYRQDKGTLQRLVDALFRGVIHRRFQLAVDWCGDVSGKQVLDAGCGSGRYCVELARRGAAVTGIDMAPAMVAMSTAAARQAGVASRCRFAAVEILEWCAPHHFDICLGIGFFDYIEDPVAVLTRLRQVTDGRGIFSFPIRWRLRTPTRWLRLTLRGCPVFFYTRSEIEALLAKAGWENVRITQLSRDYLVDAGARPTAAANESPTRDRE